MANSMNSIEDAITNFQKSIPEDLKVAAASDYAELMQRLDEIKKQIRDLCFKYGGDNVYEALPKPKPKP